MKWKVRKVQKEKRKFIVVYDGFEYETMAVSAKKAANNVWWKFFKFMDPFTETDVSPGDFVVREAE